MGKYVLEIVVFVCGAVVMIFEVLGSRVMGPYFGTSMFVWTSLIGVILGSLSLGYWWGGRLADKKADLKILSSIVFFASILIGVTTFIKDPLLVFFQANIADVRLSSVAAALVFFAPASILLGIVSPYAVKLKVNSLDTSGATVGNLYAISTFGSIAGTFLAGFYLIPQFGTNRLLIFLAVILALTSLMTFFVHKRLYALVVISLLFFTINEFQFVSGKENLVDVDTSYSRVWIYDKKISNIENGAKIMTRTMGINNENHSSMIFGSTELINEYTKYYHLIRHFKPGFEKVLLFGGAGYSFPKNFLLIYPKATIDVVEIDPGVTELAKKYFGLMESSQLKIHHQDGRVFLNQTEERYDAILGDAFGSRYSIPYQLTTLEAVRKKYDVLNDDGIVILNMISAIEGDGGKFLRAEYATYKKVFPQVYLFPVRNSDDGREFQNVILVALKSQEKPSFFSSDEELNSYLQHLWKKEIETDVPVLTDDFAPVDYYINQANKI